MAFTHHSAECFVLSMIIDAMSKWKTDLPHFAREPKMLDGKGQPVSFPLTASKIHNLGIYADWQMDGTLEGPGSGTNAMCLYHPGQLARNVQSQERDPHASEAPDGQLRQR